MYFSDGALMKTRELTLHGLLRLENEGYWAAYCLDFTLYATGETPEEAMGKLRVIVNEYLTDALVGEDQQYADDLLSRRASWRDWARFYWLSFLQHCRQIKDKLRLTAFSLPVQEPPAGRCTVRTPLTRLFATVDRLPEGAKNDAKANNRRTFWTKRRRSGRN
jgi:predicted RNase H-like HicB family nuclease